jgi:hypothetical protein
MNQQINFSVFWKTMDYYDKCIYGWGLVSFPLCILTDLYQLEFSLTFVLLISYSSVFLMGYPFVVMTNTKKLIPSKSDIEHLLNCCWVATLFGSSISGMCLLFALYNIFNGGEVPNFYELFCDEFFPDSETTIIENSEFSDENFVPID